MAKQKGGEIVVGLDIGSSAVKAVELKSAGKSYKVTAFGTEGPLKDRPGYDPLMQAYGGIMSINGHPGQPPARVPISRSRIAWNGATRPPSPPRYRRRPCGGTARR